MKGRKRHVAVDSLGLPLAIVVTGAHVQDSEPRGAGELILRLRRAADALAARTRRWPRLSRIVADNNYRGSAAFFARYVRVALVNVVRPAGTPRGFARLPTRWVIERTFGWFQGHRRLMFDVEFKVANSEGMLWVATIGLMLRRLCRPPHPS